MCVADLSATIKLAIVHSLVSEIPRSLVMVEY